LTTMKRFSAWVFSSIPLLLICCQIATAQPLLNSRRAIGDQIIFQDIKQKNKFYYAPRKLTLTTDADGKPLFQLISMRYTGTQLTGNQAEKRFTNLLQFSVSMPPVTPAELKEAADRFQLPGSAKLVPMPIRSMEATIVCAATSGNSLHRRAEAQSEVAGDKGTIWSQRSFVIPLDNHEAQILWDQYKNGRLAVSLNYAFFADVLQITEDEIKVSGDSVFVESVKNAVGEIERDTMEDIAVVASNVLDISIDLNKYPTALKQIDINENSIPPAYPSLEVKCFDFSYDIRPDLAYKRVFVEATSVSNQPVQEKIKFTKGAKDISTQFVSFRFAVRMDRPIRYKIIEGGIDGEERHGNWVQMEQFSNLIDATTQQKKQQMIRQCADVEVLPELFNDDKLTQLSALFVFETNGKSYTQRLDFMRDEATMLKTICITHDQDKPLRYFILREYTSGRKSKGNLLGLASDGYILVSK